MRNFRFLLGTAACLLAAVGAWAQNAPGALLTVDAGARGTPVSPDLYGVFFEDINYAADGGLYAEMVQNRSFEFRRGNEGWGTLKAGGAAPKVTSQKTEGLNPRNPKSLRLTTTQPGQGISNDGYDGMVLEPGQSYRFAAYLKSPDSSVTSVEVSLQNDTGAKIGFLTVTGIGPTWKKFEGTLQVTEKTSAGWLGLRPDQVGVLDLDVVSLFPGKTFQDRPNGLRSDLAEVIQGLNSRFIRFPGGCIVEGNSIANAYRWKDTIGDVAERKANENLWGYNQTYGLGFFEYFQYCEDIGAEPLPVINVGMSCQFRNGMLISMKDLGPWVQDALDLIEYANGDASTPWGAKRAQAGHPAPFRMKYLAIGNEQWGDAYFDRYKVFAQAVKAKYPEIQLIFSSGPFASGDLFDNAWAQVRRFPVDQVDEHYYMPPDWFLSNTRRYDTYDRKGPKVFVGEYAAHAENRRNNLYAALAEAAFMTGLERNGDVVQLASYAPLLAKEGATQWEPDMIRFNNTSVFGTPSYYVQSLFGKHVTKATLPSTLKVEAGPVADTSVSGGVGLGSWATQVEYKDLKVTDAQGKVLFQPAFKDGLDEGTENRGEWTAKAGTVSQTSMDTECTVTFPGEGWKGTTLSVKGRKKSGAEGMLILFGVEGSGYYWWNLGGWGNTQSAIEKGNGGARSLVGRQVPLVVDSNRWYDIRIELGNATIRCYLNNKLIHDIKVPEAPETFFTHVGKGPQGEIVIKAVNVDSRARDLKVVLDKAAALAPQGQAEVLSNADLSVENSFQEPLKVVPKTVTFNGVGPQFTYTLEPHSLTILTLKPASQP